jgi:hypothetical protein
MVKLRGLALMALLGLGAPAHAAVVDFSEYDDLKTVATVGNWIYSGNFRFTLLTSGTFEVVNYCDSCTDFITNGTQSLFLGNHASTSMAKVSGAAFSLQSVDIAGSWIYPGRWASQVTAIGLKSDGSQVSQSISLAAIGASFTTWTLSGFDDLRSVQFVPTTNANGGINNAEFQLDNLVVGAANPANAAAPSSVPEPATWTMAVAGFGLAGAAMRNGRRRRMALPA